MIATRIATSSADRPAHHALSFTPPSSTNSAMRGNTAKIDESPSESDTGS